MSQKPKFEKQMERLQAIVDELERGELSLEKSVQMYKEGQVLATACRKQLEDSRTVVAVREEDGLVPFCGEESSENDSREETE